MPQHELLACAQCGCFAFSCFEDFAIRVSWTYCDNSGKNVLFVTQYGERDFKFVVGEYVQEYQFMNILPSGNA